MKNIMATIVLCLFSVLTVKAQQEVQVKTLEPQLTDVWTIMTEMGIHAYRFELTSFLNKVYEVKFHIDEYQHGELVKSSKKKANMGKNILSITDFPEKSRGLFHEHFHLPAGVDSVALIKEASIYIIQSDSTAKVVFNIPQARKSSYILKLQKLPSLKEVLYDTRIFKQVPVKQEGSLRIPLLFYGSNWYDEKFNVFRFCGERELEPGLTGDIPAKSPHYYVISMELKEVKPSK